MVFATSKTQVESNKIQCLGHYIFTRTREKKNYGSELQSKLQQIQSLLKKIVIKSLLFSSSFCFVLCVCLFVFVCLVVAVVFAKPTVTVY